MLQPNRAAAHIAAASKGHADATAAKLVASHQM